MPRNDDISLILAKAKLNGFFPDVHDYELDAIQQYASLLFSDDTVLNSSFSTTLMSDGSADQTARINATLSSGSAFGFKKSVKLVGSFNFTQIIVPSYVTMDCSDAYMSHIPGTLINGVVNPATLSNKKTIYAAMTSGNPTLSATGTNKTDASLPFSAADVGKRVIVQGAGANGTPLDTTVLSFESTGSITLAASAGTTVSGQYATIGDRDRDITVIGGQWNRNSNGPDGHYLAHQMRFRHVDGLDVRGQRFDSYGGKYGISIADCTRFNVDNVGGPRQGSDVVHISGPASNGVISKIIADSINDDLISLTAGDSIGTLDKVRDTAGDISDIDISVGMYRVSTYTSSCLKLVAGRTMDGSAPYKIKRITGRGFIGPDTNGAVVYVGDSSNGVFEDIIIDGIRSLGGSSKGCVIIQGGDSLDRLKFTNLQPHADDSYGVSVGVSVGKLEVGSVKWTATTGSAPWCVYAAGGTISKLLVDKVQINCNGGGVLRVQSGAGVTSAITSNLNLEGGVVTFNTQAGSTLTHATANTISSSGTPYPLGFFNTVTTLSATGLSCTGVTALAWVLGSGVLTVLDAVGIDSDNYSWQGTVTHKRSSFGLAPVVKPSLTYSRATETAATTQLRTTLAALGIVTDSTVA